MNRSRGLDLEAIGLLTLTFALVSFLYCIDNELRTTPSIILLLIGTGMKIGGSYLK